jgi:hypothetical protein
MDIHTPMEPIHSWRDIALHLCIITIGLFIALSLEGLVEHIHNRHLVRDARTNIRQELEDNHEAAQQDLISLQNSIEQQKANIQAIHGLQDHPHFHGSVTNTYSINSMESAAWHTARDTGALSFMPYNEVQRYSDLYALSDFVNNQSITITQNEILAQASFGMGVDPSKFPADEYTRLLRENATIEMQSLTLRQIVQQLDAKYVAELKQ